MQDRFSSKVNDFVNWCETAIDHYNKGYYPDSLLNMRKSGEAACKLMFYYRFSEKVAVEKTEGKSYKELIQSIISHDLAERKVINWLEAMQIHGNEAAHDTLIEKEHAEFAVNALRLFINWIFTQYIKTLVPSRLKNAMISTNQPIKPENTTSRVQKELDKMKKEKEGLEKLLASLSGTKSEETEKINSLASELGKSITRLKDLETEKEKNKLKEAPIFVTQEVKTEKKKTFYSRKFVFTGAIAVSIVLILLYFFNQWNNTVSENKNKVGAAQHIIAADSFRVLILPLSIMQDNPNMALKFEDAMQNTILQRIKEKNIPVSISFDRGFVKPTISFDDAIREGINHSANIVLFGELYEPQSSSDSAQVNVKFAMTGKQNRISEEMGILSFLRLSDNSSLKIQMGAACYVDLSFANFLIEKREFNQALMVLYDASPISKSQQLSAADFLAICHSSKKNYPAAIREIEKLIALEPKEADYGHLSMANVLKDMGDFQKAEGYYKKALSIKPNNINTLLNYAQMLSFNGMDHYGESKELILQAIRYDSTSSMAWWYLGDITKAFGDFKNAEKQYRKSLSIDPTNTFVKINLAQILSFNLEKPEEGEKILTAMLIKDSTNANVFYTLASIYSNTKLKNPDKAEYFLAKGKKYQTSSNDYLDKYNEAFIALQKFDYKKAVRLFTDAYHIDSSDMVLCNNLATCHLNLQDYNKAYYFIIRGWKKDTLDCINNANMGYFYMYSDKQHADLKKAAYYYEKSLKTNPYNIGSLENLATLYYNFGNIPLSKNLLFRLYKLQPDNFNANQGLGVVYELEGDPKKALPYYEKAVSLNPDNDQVNCKYALTLMKVSMDNYSRAFVYAKKAVELNPGGADNLFILAQMYIVGKDYKRGKEYYGKALEINPSLKDSVIEQDMEKLLMHLN